MLCALLLKPRLCIEDIPITSPIRVGRESQRDHLAQAPGLGGTQIYILIKKLKKIKQECWTQRYWTSD
jgi:hypothetical protein